jgi:8-oxo-dGTP pyrophosphatase MutT (NUDIX family)
MLGGMTTLGSLLKPAPQALDISSLVAAVAPGFPGLPSFTSIAASITAWTEQDDDAHEPCSLTACRSPLHPGPCKGWKGTLHAIAPGTYHQIEAERVQKANARRVKRIADLKSQGKPIPRHLLAEIKPKPAPTHNAQHAQPVPLGQVNQKADLAGGQAHAAGQAVSNAAGVTVKTAPALPLGPKQKKPSVAGRGPAFVITQPKVTDTYKLDKAAKLTPQEWDALSPADKTAIRDELTAIKARGFGPQQTKADALLAKLPAANTVSSTSKPNAPSNAPGTGSSPAGKVNAAPGRVTLGQATKTIPSTPSNTPSTPQLPAPAPSPSKGTRDQNGILNKPLPGGSTSSTSVGLPSGYRITRDGMGYSLKHNGKLIRTSATQGALEQYAKDHAKGIADAQAKHAANPPVVKPMNTPSLPDQIKADQVKAQQATPAAPAAPKPAAPAVLSPDAQQARAVAGRGVPKAQMAKTHIDVYGKLSKADFDSLDDKTQRTIRDDLANAKAKFLDPKKAQVASDLLDRFGSRHPAPAPAANAPAAPPSGKSQTYTVTHNGKTVTRTSSKPYTHAAVTRYSDGTEGVTFHTSHANAAKGNLTLQQKTAGASVVKVLPVTTTGGAPNAPTAKGYSDPMNEAVKAATGGAPADDVIKRVGQLSHTSIGKLDDADRKAITTRLNSIASAGSAGTPHTKARAVALKKMIEAGPQPDGTKRDHEPSLNELHAEAQTAAAKDAVKVQDALKAATAKHANPLERADRIKDLTALSKAQFDALTPEDQRKITDALHALHTDHKDASGTTALDPAADAALQQYTGLSPSIHRLRQAEADFRAGKITADQFRQQFLHARVQAPTKYNDPKSPGAILEKEAQRVAEDNPTLPLWLRAEMIANPYNSRTGTYGAIQAAENQYNYGDAPRLSHSDITGLFGATEAELASSHPIHVEAVKALRLHVIETGLAPGSPWSTATKNHIVDNLLHISSSDLDIPPDRVKEFNGLSDTAKVRVLRVLRQRINDQTNDHAKTGTWFTLQQIDGSAPLSPEQRAAALAAADRYSRPDLDLFRKLSPLEYDALPFYARAAIGNHLAEAQTRLERGGPVSTWLGNDNALKVFPLALKDHLNGKRQIYADRAERNASDIANYGQKIVNPFDRQRVYQDVVIRKFRTMSTHDQQAIHADLEYIAGDPTMPLGVRYKARLTRDVYLDDHRLNAPQLSAVAYVDPLRTDADADVTLALDDLDKADFDNLNRVFRDAIDARVASLPGADQQRINAKFHPGTAANNPSGLAATSPTAATPLPPHIQAAVDTIYGVHPSGKSHTMAHQLSTYGALRGYDFDQLNSQEQGHLLGDLSFIATTAKGPSADKARKLIDRFTPAGTPSGQIPTGAVIPPANSVPGQVRYATPLKGLEQAKDSGVSGDGWISLPGGGRVWGAHGAAGLLLMHQDPATGEKRYLMVQRGPAISDPGKWTFPGGASDSKETPHQGAARETIEELGLKPDALKDALIHGDHTFSVPNHTWKYTTVAAQVPTMIKPNLTTAHARAETSDAKWMTIDEIRALDKSGSLHHPIAGGKLEQNVISLYPDGTAPKGQTLGQIVRPGPVTKRQGRLRLPANGRQAPNTPPNAWTKPHKPSKGKDLIPDKATLDAQRQKIKQDRKLFDGKTADGRLAAIGAQQGFDDTPTVVDKKEIDRLLATGDYIEAWRGVSGSGGYNWRASKANGKTAKQINEEMKSGPAYYGKGIFGNGYYLATQHRVATQYADGTSGSIVRILIPKSAVTQKYDKVQREAHANPRMSKAKGSGYDESTFYDPGRYAAAKGLDGIEIEHHHTSPGGGARHVASSGKPAFNWLNRSVLIIQKEPG